MKLFAKRLPILLALSTAVCVLPGHGAGALAHSNPPANRVEADTGPLAGYPASPSGLQIRDLGSFSSYPTGTNWYGVNDSGELGGDEVTKTIDGITEVMAARWVDGAVTSVGTPDGYAVGIDDAGDLFGTHVTPTKSGPCAFNCTYYIARWSAGGGEYIDTADPSPDGASFVSVSSNGIAVGAGYKTPPFIARPPDYAFENLPSSLDGPGDVNNLGHVAASNHFYDGSSVVTTGIAPGGRNGLNNHDDIAGWDQVGKNFDQPAMWHAGGLTLLPKLPGEYAEPLGLNDSGVAIGTTSPNASTAVMWKGAVIKTLNSMLPKKSPWDLMAAFDITDTGYILGWGTNAAQQDYFLARIVTHRVSGTITKGSCSETVCVKPKPLPGVEVTAKSLGPQFGGTATSGKDGTWSMQLAPGDYTLTPNDGQNEFDPSSRKVVALAGDLTKQDFNACEGESGAPAGVAARRGGSLETEPCQRLYTISLGSWLPQRFVTDWSAVGADSFDGSDYPVTARSLEKSLSLGYLGQDAYPPCLGEATLKQYEKTRPDMTWRARFIGSGSSTWSTTGLGWVTVPVAYNGETKAVEFRDVSITPGSMVREYDWKVGDTTGSCQTPPRPVVATVGTRILGNGGFQIEVSWPFPYKPYEDLGDIDDFSAPLAQVTKVATDEFDAQLQKIPHWNDLSQPQKDGALEWGKWLLKRVGLKQAIEAIEYIVKSGPEFLADRTPPPIKYGKKALDLVKKLAYGSADVRITGHLATGRAGTQVTLTTESDQFPSFGMRVTRSRQKIAELPWRASTQSITTTNDVPSNFPDNVVNDGGSGALSDENVRGGPAAKGTISGDLAILHNVTPSSFSDFLPPILAGNDSLKRTISWTFIAARS